MALAAAGGIQPVLYRRLSWPIAAQPCAMPLDITMLFAATGGVIMQAPGMAEIGLPIGLGVVMVGVTWPAIGTIR